MNWKLYLGYFISFIVSAYYLNVPLGNFLELTIPYLLFDGHSFFFDKNFVDIRVAKKITSEIFYVLDPAWTNKEIKMIITNFVPCWRNNVLDLFRWTHFRTCLTDPELLKIFDEIFRARFAGLYPSTAMQIYKNSDWTLEQLYLFRGKGFVTATEIQAVYDRFNPLDKTWNEITSRKIFSNAFVHFHDFKDSLIFVVLGPF